MLKTLLQWAMIMASGALLATGYVRFGPIGAAAALVVHLGVLLLADRAKAAAGKAKANRATARARALTRGSQPQAEHTFCDGTPLFPSE